MTRHTTKAARTTLAGEDDYVRVSAVDNPGTEFTIRSTAFDPQLHTRLDKPALDRHGDPADPKYPANIPPAIPARPAGNDASGAANPGDTENGHQAENEGEN